MIPIGIVHSPYKNSEGTPIQASTRPNISGTIEIYPPYLPGLKDVDGFNYIIVLYHFHQAKGEKLHVVPYLDQELRGVFATRAPSRPNHIGFSIVKLVKIQDNLLTITPLDMLDRTPILDIKPFIPQFDCEHIDLASVSIGWLTSKIQNRKKTADDGRFT